MELRGAILAARRPLVIKNRSASGLLTWDAAKWTEVLGPEPLDFRCGKRARSREPQFAGARKKASFADFRSLAVQPDEWWYFDYKYLCQWFTDKDALRQCVDWSEVGFPELTADDSTIWIGSEGAHSPCHQDTYGTNVVLQVLGKKRWILLPPWAHNLQPTRQPFEESTVYSKLNFFSPNLDDFKQIDDVFEVTLEPGDFLVVPQKWWHYVESLELSISVNAWVPRRRDAFERVKEGVATILARKFALDGNAASEEAAILKIVDSYESRDEPSVAPGECADVCAVPQMSKSDFELFLARQSERFASKTVDSGSITVENGSQRRRSVGLSDVLDVLMSDDVLDLVASKLVGQK